MRSPAELRTITRVGAPHAGVALEDFVAVEAPLTLTSQGDVWLTTMRTPGHDRELIVGWLYHEGLVADPRNEISRLTTCGDPDDSNFGDAYELVPNALMESRLKSRDPALSQRTQVTSCGLCGHALLDDLVRRVPAHPRRRGSSRWPEVTIRRAFADTIQAQPLFAQTGATHSASLVNLRSEVLLTREDVGRHNTVDKVVGHLALNGQLPPPEDVALLVSSRASFEIVHKAACAGFATVLCVSAPTSLAIDLAERCGILLVGFFRAGGFNVYSEHSRVTQEGR
jgi:FdhD protein